MKSKELIFEEEARLKLREGITKLADIVGVTLGPKGRYVALEEGRNAPTITSDGYSIIKHIEFKDQFINMGVAIAKDASSKMKEQFGDGTTTTMLLIKAFVENGLKNIAAGASPIVLKRGMEKGVELIIEELSKLSKPITKPEETFYIASASASGDEEIGRLIAQALQKVGMGGVVTIEEGQNVTHSLEMVEGLQFERGYLSPYFCTNTEAMNVEMQQAAILLTDKKISSIQEILPMLQAVASTGQHLLIIADDLEGDALSTLVINKLQGILKACAVKAPGFGDQRKALLEDLAALTGATVISEEKGLSLKEATIDLLGSAQKIVVSKEKTTLIGGCGDLAAIQHRIQSIDVELLEAKNSFDKERLCKRRAQLSGGVAILRVGAVSEPEMRQKKQLFEDSLNSTQAALEDGIVPGGGVALLRASACLSKLEFTGDEKTAIQIVLKACEAPFRQIVQNTGHDSSLYLEKVLSAKPEWGFNALTEQLEDLLLAGIVDPCKIVKGCLTIALSAAGTILLSDVLIGHTPND